MKLLTLGNPKTAKGEGHGYLTAVLHLAPANLSGFEMCPKRTKGCTCSCLNTAGRGGIFAAGEETNAIQLCRIRRARLLIEDPSRFLRDLSSDIGALRRAAERNDLRPALRLDGTSDLDWSDLARDLGRHWVARDIDSRGVAKAFRFMLDNVARSTGVRLYDYTKRADKIAWYARHAFPVHLTFSRAETFANKRDARKVAEAGGNVAVVFATRKGRPLPATFEGRPVIDGDAHDLRFRDPAGVVVGLRAKGRARKDASGFVVPV